MMFDWNDQDQVGETIWGEFNEAEDHIVPYTKDTEEHPVFSFDDCSKKQKNNDTNTIAQSSGQISGAKNAFPDTDLENRYSLNANEDYSGSKLDMDPWPDLPILDTELCAGELSSLNKSFPLAGGTVQLDGGSEFFSNAREEKENDSFLDCDWANIGDFDDLDRIFRNESIFGHDMATNVDDFLSSSADMIGNTLQPIPMPDIPLCRDEPSDPGCSSFQLVEHAGEKRRAADKTAETVETREQAFRQTTHSNQLTEKVILSPGIGQQSKVGDTEPVENIGSSAQFMYPRYGYPVYPFTGTPILQLVQADRSGNSEGPVGHNPYPDPLKYPNSSSMALEVQSKQLAMTPQDKIKKFRWCQQAQAMLAIQQRHQQQQSGHQIIGAEDIVSQGNKIQDASNTDLGVQENEKKLLASAQNLLLEHDGSQRISTLSDDNSLEKNIYSQLQEALRKLDTRVRLSIRDSLSRLASSSTERQNASDGNSSNKSAKDECDVPVNEESSSGKRPMRLPDAETYTNPIDRTVAHLLFHRPLESCTRPVNTEMLQSHML